MPEIERRLPRPAFCEEWDEDAQTTLPDSRSTATVAVKRSQQELMSGQREPSFRRDGSDSGYASRADTASNGSTSMGRRKMPSLRVDTAAVPERERQPYSLSQAGPSKPTARRQSSSQGKESPAEPRPAKSRHDVHPGGSCRTRDKYGKHIDVGEETSKASSTSPPLPSPTAVRQGGFKGIRDDTALPSKSRRPSSGQQPRPLSMVSDQPLPLQYVNQPLYAPPAFATTSWGTPITPSVPYSPASYAYGPAPMPAPMLTPAYSSLQPGQSYFDHAMTPEPPSARQSRRSSPVRRSSAYGDPVIRQGYREPSIAGLERVKSKESRPIPSSHKSSRSIDHDRAMMPPPPKPQQPDIGLARRPSTGRSEIYHSRGLPPRQHFSYEPERYDQDDEDNDYREPRAPLATLRERRESPPRPPTSYRPPAAVESRGRPPLPRKSVSYATSGGTTKVESSRPHIAARQTTLPAVPLSAKEAAVEEYLRHGGKPSNELTAEALRDFNHRNSAPRSEAESSYSHKSRQSSSKESSGQGKSQATTTTKTSITLPGGVNMSIPSNYMNKDGRPLSINVGGLVVSVGAEEGNSVERPREQRRIERAPSIASRASKKSVSSSISNRDGDVTAQLSRRLSHVEEQAISSRSSRQHSRAPSTSEHSYEYTRRQSVDYGRPYEEVIYGA